MAALQSFMYIPRFYALLKESVDPFCKLVYYVHKKGLTGEIEVGEEKKISTFEEVLLKIIIIFNFFNKEIIKEISEDPKTTKPLELKNVLEIITDKLCASKKFKAMFRTALKEVCKKIDTFYTHSLKRLKQGKELLAIKKEPYLISKITKPHYWIYLYKQKYG